MESEGKENLHPSNRSGWPQTPRVGKKEKFDLETETTESLDFVTAADGGLRMVGVSSIRELKDLKRQRGVRRQVSSFLLQAMASKVLQRFWCLEF